MSAKQPTGTELATRRILDSHERAITAGMRSFIEIGRHLGIIKRDELYRVAGFETFAEYAEQRFDLARQHAYRMIDTARIALTLSPNGDKIISEFAARELIPLSSDGEKLRAVFDEACLRSNGKRPSAALLRDVRDELYPGAETIDGEVVPPAPALPVGDPLAAIPEAERAIAERLANQTAAEGSNAPADGADEFAAAPAGDGGVATSAVSGNPLTAAGSTVPADGPDTAVPTTSGPAVGGSTADLEPPAVTPTDSPAGRDLVGSPEPAVVATPGQPETDQPVETPVDEAPEAESADDSGAAVPPTGTGVFPVGDEPAAGPRMPAAGDPGKQPATEPAKAELGLVASMNACTAVHDLDDFNPHEIGLLLDEDVLVELRLAHETLGRWLGYVAEVRN
jgi:hypothetical protein